MTFDGRLSLTSRVSFEHSAKVLYDTEMTTTAKSRQLQQFQLQFSQSRGELLDTETKQQLAYPLSTKGLLEAARDKLLIEGRKFDNRVYNSAYKVGKQPFRKLKPEQPQDKALRIRTRMVKGGSLAASKSPSLLDLYFQSKQIKATRKELRHAHDLDLGKALRKLESTPMLTNRQLTSEQRAQLNTAIEVRLAKKTPKPKVAKDTHLFQLQFNRTKSQSPSVQLDSDSEQLFMTQPLIYRSSSVCSLASLTKASNTAEKLEGLKLYCETVRSDHRMSNSRLNTADAQLKHKLTEVKSWLEPKNRQVDPDYMNEHIDIYRKERGELVVFRDKKLVMRL